MEPEWKKQNHGETWRALDGEKPKSQQQHSRVKDQKREGGRWGTDRERGRGKIGGVGEIMSGVDKRFF